MYYLYLDESGRSKDILETDGPFDIGDCKFFTIGGIIVNDEYRKVFKTRHDSILNTYFKSAPKDNFKLHYEELRNAHTRKEESVYKEFDWITRRKIADDVFKAISEFECFLLSITIDLEKHYGKYSFPYSPLAYGLYLILERFRYFLDDYEEQGRVIYERYNDTLRHHVDQTHREMDQNRNFPNYTNITSISNVTPGDPFSDPMLVFADFFAFAPWIKCASCCKKIRRYDEIKSKYYNLDHWLQRKRGNYEI